MNALHDKAFDKDFITIKPNFEIIISADIRNIYDGAAVEEFLTYHNEVVFENWE